jgi:hypothetical protein
MQVNSITWPVVMTSLATALNDGIAEPGARMLKVFVEIVLCTS